jgi:hypothetical protein
MNYSLARIKRGWVPERLWRVFCVGGLALYTPFREILTRVPTAAERES